MTGGRSMGCPRAFHRDADTVDQRKGGWTWLLGRLDAELSGALKAVG